MLCIVHAQGKPTHSFCTEATAECIYDLDGVPVISASLLKGILRVSYSSLQCEVQAFTEVLVPSS